MNRNLFIIALFAAILSFVAPSCSDYSRQRSSDVGETHVKRELSTEGAKKDETLASLGGYPYETEPIYLVGTRPVTEEELKRYMARMLPGRDVSNHGSFDPEKAVSSFARFWTVVLMGVEEGLEDDKAVNRLVEAYRYIALANDFRSHLEKTLALSPEEVESLMHDEWVQMDFSILTFSDMEEAEISHREIVKDLKSRKGKDREEFIAEKFKSSTGMIFKKSGFFDPFDEPYLFGLKKGTVSKQVMTGIGAGVCYVKERIDMDEKDIDAYLEREKGKITGRKIDERFSGITSDLEYSIMEENVARSVLMEGMTGEFSDLVVLTISADQGEIPIRYRDLRSLVPQNYKPLFKAYPSDSWINFVMPDIRNLANTWAIGAEAEREGIELDEKWNKEMFDFRLKTIYSAELERLMKRPKVSVDDGAVKKYYEQNRGFFAHGVLLQVSYYYSPEEGGLESLIRQAGSKEKLFTEEKYRYLRKERKITRNDMLLQGLFQSVNHMKTGDVSGVIRADMGYYLVKIEERVEKGFTPFEEVREEIEKYLSDREKWKVVRSLIEERRKGLKINTL